MENNDPTVPVLTEADFNDNNPARISAWALGPLGDQLRSWQGSPLPSLDRVWTRGAEVSWKAGSRELPNHQLVQLVAVGGPTAMPGNEPGLALALAALTPQAAARLLPSPPWASGAQPVDKVWPRVAAMLRLAGAPVLTARGRPRRLEWWLRAWSPDAAVGDIEYIIPALDSAGEDRGQWELAGQAVDEIYDPSKARHAQVAVALHFEPSEVVDLPVEELACQLWPAWAWLRLLAAEIERPFSGKPHPWLRQLREDGRNPLVDVEAWPPEHDPEADEQELFVRELLLEPLMAGVGRGLGASEWPEIVLRRCLELIHEPSCGVEGVAELLDDLRQ